MTRMLQFIDDYDVTKGVSWAGWIDRWKANSVAWTRLFFSHVLFVPARWLPETDRADWWLFCRAIMDISWARYVGRAFCADLCELAKLVRSII